MRSTTEFLYSSRFFVILSLFLFTMIIALTLAQVRRQQDLRSLASVDLENCTVNASAIQVDNEEQQAEKLINDFRKENNLKPLDFNESLNRAAAWQSEDMAKEKKLSHTDSAGRDISKRFSDCGYKPFKVIKENITDIAKSGEEAFNAWKTSPPHREAMLCQDCEDIGLARAEGRNNGDTVWYWTMNAGALLSSGREPTASPSVTLTPTLTVSPAASESTTLTPTLPPVTVSRGPLRTGTPSGTLSPNATVIELTVRIPGIGKTGNTTPKRVEREVLITLSDRKNAEVGRVTGTLKYDSATGTFKGIIGLPNNIQSGSYLIKIKTDYSIARIISSGFLAVEKGRITKLPDVILPAADLDQNNEISFLDVVRYRQCLAGKKCPGAQTDLNDDGGSNILDYNVFLEIFGNYQGE